MTIPPTELERIMKRAAQEAAPPPVFPTINISGLKCRILFDKRGYYPHNADHVIDPIDKREKLVMGDPQLRKVIIYDVEKGEIEWEYEVPGTAILLNPHIAHMLLEPFPDINGEAGDIICADRDRRYICVDRETKEIKWNVTLPFANWPHDIMPSVDPGYLVGTDYGAARVYKFAPDGTVIWSTAIPATAKMSLIEPATPAGYRLNSFGGDYLVVQNEDTVGVHEVRDSDGAIVWKAGGFAGVMNAPMLFRPHSAFRMGWAEAGGVLTIVGFEAGGGIVAIDRDGRPRWGIMTAFTRIPEWMVRPTSYGLVATTHVFPTLGGRIGLVDGGSVWQCNRVLEVLEIPYKQSLAWHLAADRDPGDAGEYYDPPIEILEWDTVILCFVNRGANSLDYTVYGTRHPYLHPADFPYDWTTVASGTVAAGAIVEVEITKPYTAIRVHGIRTVAGAGSTWRIHVLQKR